MTPPDSQPVTGELPAGAATEASVVAELALRATAPTRIDPLDVYTVVVPGDGSLDVVDLERKLERPRRPRGTYRPATVTALIAHVERHHFEAETTLWVHPTSGRIVAVFNDHGIGSTGWGDFRSELNLQATDEWRFWLAQDGKLLSQTEFAEHVEQGLTEIAEPAGADLLELAQTFHASQSAMFRSAVRVDSGTVQLQYDQEVQASAGKHGEISVPQQFTLAIAPFLGEQPQALTARLRYRVRDGRLSLGYKLIRPNDVVRGTLAGIAERLAEKFTDVFLGEPPAAA